MVLESGLFVFELHESCLFICVSIALSVLVVCLFTDYVLIMPLHLLEKSFGLVL